MNKTKKGVIGLFLIIVLISFSSSFVFAEENDTLNSENLSRICLQESKEIFQELDDLNFTVQRVNDTLNEAQNLYDAQIILKEQKSKYDFSLVLPYCEQIKSIKENAFTAKDELIALEKFYEEFLTEDMNTSSIDFIILEIKGEIDTERYEKVKPLIDEGYEEIVDIKSEYTTLNLFYKTTTRGVMDFFYDNWIYLSVGIVVLLIMIFIYNKAIRKMLIKRKIAHLEIKKDTMKDLIKKLQGDYFEAGTLSENDYTIKTKKFAELIRDIDREIPLLKEAFIKIQKNLGDKIDQKIIKTTEKKIVKEELKKPEKSDSSGMHIKTKTIKKPIKIIEKKKQGKKIIKKETKNLGKKQIKKSFKLNKPNKLNKKRLIKSKSIKKINKKK